ncbi:hypothetical protein D8674_034813 [Pyrus ussuriensis x Pyrus communis]|uniref:Uncharacterized protein n=1 Tax=Pyrus ussuriensis x Pyrus communis TaxID=2448454 RepID=A0A5N5GBH8_9ROSA|nr:hypothetical protein D8674_034813 [Pyrus ussuriensis x Pyrus communis]
MGLSYGKGSSLEPVPPEPSDPSPFSSFSTLSGVGVMGSLELVIENIIVVIADRVILKFFNN